MHPIWTCDDAGNILHANADACRFTDHAPEERARRTLPELFCEADREQVRTALRQLAEKESVTGRWRPARQDEYSPAPDFVLHRLPDGRVVVVASGDFPDETSPDQCGRSQGRTAIMHQQMMDAASNMLVYAFDLEGRCLIANRPVATVLHTTPGAMLGRMRDQFMPEEIALTHFANDQVVVRSGQPVIFEEVTANEGGVKIFSSMKFPLRDAAGNLFAVGGISSDITAQRAAETAQQHSERHFESLAMIAPVGIFRTDAGGNCNYINDFWCRMAGMSQEEALGRGWVKALHPDDRQKVIDEWQRCIAENSAFKCEYRLLRPDGEVTWLYGQTTPICDAGGIVTGHVGAVTDITPIKQTQEALVEARRQIGVMAQKCVEIQEEERTSLSRELHDEVGQMMTALKLSLTQASRKAFTEPASAVKSINYSVKIADEVIGSMRNIARRLRPPQLDDLGLMASLRWHVDRIAAQSVPTILFHENIGNARFEPNLELACFRIAQEAISNALRHAQASFICVVLVRLHGQLELSILDDGDGFCETAVEKSGTHSLGLLGMRERTIGCGGTFRINSESHTGTEILAKFTLPPTS